MQDKCYTNGENKLNNNMLFHFHIKLDPGIKKVKTFIKLSFIVMIVKQSFNMKNNNKINFTN